MSQTSARSTRFDIRIPAHVRDAVEMAASLEGRSITDFLIAAMLEKAEGVISAHKRLEFSLRDQSLLAQALNEDKPQTPTPWVRRMVHEYRTEVESR